MKDIKDYLEQTNTVLLTKDAFKYLKNCADIATRDAISRQWLIECVNEGWIKFDTEKDKNIFIHLIRDIAPPVTPQSKTETVTEFADRCRECGKMRKGHWIAKDDKEQGYDIGGVKTWYIQIMCSECGFIKTAIEGHTGHYKYCPNCGCRMVESLERSDKE